MNQTPRRLLTVDEVAEILREHPETVRSRIRRREIAAIRLGGSRSPYRIRPEAVDAFLNRRERPAAR